MKSIYDIEYNYKMEAIESVRWEDLDVDIKNYQLGDWVTIIECHSTPVCACDKLNSDTRSGAYIGNLYNPPTYPDMYHIPIYLDEHILQDNDFDTIETPTGTLCTYKCGLVDVDSTMKNIEIHIMLEDSMFENNSIIVFSDEEIMVSLPIKYLHELQHIFQLCGLGSKKFKLSEDVQYCINEKIKKLYENYYK